MEYIRITNISESDFDKVVEAAGGKRLPGDGVADYILEESIIELKFVQEEGFDKETRREKIEKLFQNQQPKSPVVIIDPELLDERETRNYINTVAGPIKTHVKKAASQLENTARRHFPDAVKVLVILNIGYTALAPDEFKDICIKCVTNDTRKIDYIVCGGIYFHSDKFDNYVISRFEDVPINVSVSFSSSERLARSWADFVEQKLTDLIRGGSKPMNGRMPVLDLVWDHKGIRYVKPAPQMPPSGFWPGGRPPRDNTSGIDRCPAIAIPFPTFTRDDWSRFREVLSTPVLQRCYADWRGFQDKQQREHNQPTKPFVPIKITYDELALYISKPTREWEFSDVCRYAGDVFERRIAEILAKARERSEMTVIPSEFIHLIVKEIGQDKANDLSSISYVSALPRGEREDLIIDNVRAFWEYGMALAAAYAVHRDVDVLLYTKEHW